jgi:hypothetical protein
MFKFRAVRTALAAASAVATLATGGAAYADTNPVSGLLPTTGPGACPPAGAIWQTTSRETDYQHGPFVLDTNEWNPAGGSDSGIPASWMTTWAGIGSSWGVCAHESGTGWPYPEERLFTGKTPISSLSALASGYSETTPSDGQYDSAYDIWLNQPNLPAGQTPPEVMVWTANHGEGTGNPKYLGTATIAGHQYRVSVCDACKRVTFEFPSDVPATTVNLLAVLRYAAQHPASAAVTGKNPVITEIDRGWEIYRTNGTEPFTTHSYWLAMRHKSAL